jgi:hypothetical protein
MIEYAVIVAMSALLFIQRRKMQSLTAYYRGREDFYLAKFRSMKLALQRALTSPTEEALDLTMAEMVDQLNDRDF